MHYLFLALWSTLVGYNVVLFILHFCNRSFSNIEWLGSFCDPFLDSIESLDFPFSCSWIHFGHCILYVWHYYVSFLAWTNLNYVLFSCTPPLFLIVFVRLCLYHCTWHCLFGLMADATTRVSHSHSPLSNTNISCI